MKDWIQWWDVRKEKILLAFTRFEAPQSNLAEVLHAGWKHRDKMGVSLLECCNFDVRDSIPLTINQGNVRDGCYDGEYGPNNEELTTRKRKRQEEQARQLGDLLDFGVNSRSTNPTKKKQIEPPEMGCYPPKKIKNVEEILQKRVATARDVHNIMKISNFKSSEQCLVKPCTS